ncbi:hypothetical protein RAE06_09110 [Corynebacterium tuberculostearicum]|uniref:hypothetical protein n=1 Tax=Corynebacterium tuberculostearicum TaxID=38304 RepID=UPI002934A327|nr:hypothetical protein [Corynebacterium tuberculostearicum]MDV2429045.1 hypothetical protein [Corynebacterium tuberculostearicum]
MNLNPVARFKSAQTQPTISVKDVERVRRQRRLAKTEEEYSDVRSQMRELVAELRSTPERSPQLKRIAGQDDVIEDMYRRLANAREELAQADTPAHRIEAVLAVDSVLATAKELRISE